MKVLEYLFWVILISTFILFFVYIGISAVYGPTTGMEHITTYIS